MVDDGWRDRVAALERRVEDMVSMCESLVQRIAEVSAAVRSGESECCAREDIDVPYVMPCVDDGGGYGGAFRIEENDEGAKKIVDGYVMFGRKVVHASDFDIGETSGSYCVHVSHPRRSTSVTAEILNQSVGEDTDYDTYIPLFDLDGEGKVSNDHRGMPCMTAYE